MLTARMGVGTAAIGRPVGAPGAAMILETRLLSDAQTWVDAILVPANDRLAWFIFTFINRIALGRLAAVGH